MAMASKRWPEICFSRNDFISCADISGRCRVRQPGVNPQGNARGRDFVCAELSVAQFGS